jgi:hypothetical protein
MSVFRALYTLFYNFIRTHGKLRMSPAMHAGLAETFLSFEDVLARIDAKQVAKPRVLTKSEPPDMFRSVGGASWRDFIR